MLILKGKCFGQNIPRFSKKCFDPDAYRGIDNQLIIPKTSVKISRKYPTLFLVGYFSFS